MSFVFVTLQDNLVQFLQEEDIGVPKGKYRRVVFAKWYKAVFCIFENKVFVDAIMD
jgi:hypothetical protein